MWVASVHTRVALVAGLTLERMTCWEASKDSELSQGKGVYHVLCLMQVVLNVISAADAVVGRYTMNVNKFDAGVFFLLFNPWCSGNSECSSALERVPFTCRSCVTPRDVPIYACLQFAVQRVLEPFFSLSMLSN